MKAAPATTPLTELVARRRALLKQLADLDILIAQRPALVQQIDDLGVLIERCAPQIQDTPGPMATMKIHERPEHQLWWTAELIESLGPSLAERLNVASDAQRDGQFERADEILRHIIAEHALTALPVEILCPLPTRVIFPIWKALGQAATVADLVRRPLRDLRRWKNFGKVSISLLGGRLRALGLNLTGQQDYSWIRPLPGRLRDRMLIIPPCVPKDTRP